MSEPVVVGLKKDKVQAAKLENYLRSAA